MIPLVFSLVHVNFNLWEVYLFDICKEMGSRVKSYHLIIRYICLCVDFGDGLHQLKIVLGIVSSISTKIRETKIKEVTPDK